MAIRFSKVQPLTFEQFFKIDRAANQGSKHEACGILVGRIVNDVAIVEEVRQIKNISDDPQNAFVFDPQEYYDAIADTTWFAENAAYELLGMWHTHPDFPGYPSSYDWAAALAGKVIEGAYLLYTTKGQDLYNYYWDGKQFLVLRRV